MVRVFLLNVASRKRATLNKKKPGPPKKSVWFLDWRVSAFRVHVRGVPTVSLARVVVGGWSAAVHFWFGGFTLQGSAFGVYNSGSVCCPRHNENTPTTLRGPNFGAKTLDLRGQPTFFFLHVFSVFCLAPCGQSRSQPKSVAAKVGRATSPRERAESARESAQSPQEKTKTKTKKKFQKKRQTKTEEGNKQEVEGKRKEKIARKTYKDLEVRPIWRLVFPQVWCPKKPSGFHLAIVCQVWDGFRLQGKAFGVYSSGLAFVFQHTMKTHPPTL